MRKPLEFRPLLFACLVGSACCACSSSETDPAPAPEDTGPTTTSPGSSTPSTTATSNTGTSSATSSNTATGTSSVAPGSSNSTSTSTTVGPVDSSPGETSSPGPTSEGPSGGGETSSPEGTSEETSGPGGEDTGAPEPTNPGTCTPSEPTGTRATGSGPHEVVVETNSDPGIDEGTIFRPADLGGAEKYPIFVWGQGGCSQNGLSNAEAMAEIASHGYFVVADGTPNGSGNRTMDRSDLDAMGAPLMAYVDWAIAENAKPCSVYYQSLEPTMVASNGFSCGGLMAQGTVLDPRIVTWGVTSSGMAGATQAFYDAIHTPVLFVEGGPDEVAYDGGLEGFERISELDVPVLWFDKPLGHGGDLFTPGGGDFTKINLAWLNWWLKGDETATGKGLLVGASCPYCSDATWDVRSANVP